MRLAEKISGKHRKRLKPIGTIGPAGPYSLPMPPNGLACLSILLIVVIFPILNTPAQAGQEIRVLVGQKLRGAKISGQGLRIVDGVGRPLPTADYLVITASRNHLVQIAGFGGPVPGPVRVIGHSSPIRWEGAYYRGTLEFRAGSGRLNIVNILGLEQYLCGQVNSEVPARWPMEALKAQAVAARTYALWKKMHSDTYYHLKSTTHDQVYHGAHVENARAIEAVRSTLGWYMAYKGKPILAYYHSCCGGHTDSARHIKGKNLPYLNGVPCGWCRESPRYHWKLTVSRAELAAALKKKGVSSNTIERVYPVKRSPAGRILEMEIISPRNTLFLSGEDLRAVLGHNRLLGTRFEVSSSANGFTFTGTGFGHGLGACQWGFKGMADKGYNWRQILSHYYRGIQFMKLRN